MGRKSRNVWQHDLDSLAWSATRSAKRAIHLRDNILDRMNGNRVIEAVFAVEFRELHSKYTEVYMDRGYGEVIAAQRAASDLWMARYTHDEDHRELYESMAAGRMVHLLESVDQAELYVVSPAMHATISAAVATLSTEDLRRFAPDDIVAPTGFLLLPEIQPVYMSEEAVAPEEIIAFSWQANQTTKTDKNGDVVPETLLYVTTWMDCNGPAESPDFDMIREAANERGEPIPDIMPIANAALRMDFQESKEDDPEINEALRGVHLPYADNVVPGEYSGEAIRGIPVMDWSLQYLMAFMRLSSQKVSTESKFSEGISHDVKRKPYHDVRVVHLRGYSADKDETNQGPGTDRNYTRRWVVRMHKVNQWYPSTNSHKIIWRGPFIKGPENAPLMSGEKVNVL